MSTSGSEWQAPPGPGPQGPEPWRGGQSAGGGPWPGSTSYGGPPSPVPSEDRTWAMAAHLGSFLAAYVALGLLAPLLVLLVRGQRSPFLERHAKESLNFQLTTLIVAVVGVVVGIVATVVTLGLAALVLVPAAIAWVVFYVVVVIIASVRAWNGEQYSYPLTLRLVR